MRHATIFATLCVALATVLAAPGADFNLDKDEQYLIIPDNAQLEKIRIQATLKEFDFMEFTTRDYMTDMIWAILGITAGELLTSIEYNMNELSNLIGNGVIELHDILHQLDPKTQQQIQDVINKALNDALSSITPILEDLGLVLPSITFRSTTTARSVSVSDLIMAILGMSLEDLLVDIAAVLEMSQSILTGTMTELTSIANSIQDPTVSSNLKTISNAYLEKGMSVIRPILSNLYKVLPSKASKDEILASVVSEAIGFDVIETSDKLDMTLDKIEKILEEFVNQLNRILGWTQPKLRNKVNKILKKSVNDIEARIQPILNVLLPFAPTKASSSNDQDIISTLLGVSLEDFLNYLDFAIKRVEEIYQKAAEDVKTACVSTRPHILFQIILLIDKTMEQLEENAKPLLEMISPILGEKKWVSVEEFVEITKTPKGSHKEKVFCNFSFSTGYNLDLIIHLVSKTLKFDVVAAANAMVTALQKLDELYGVSAQEINDLLHDAHPFVINEVNRILNMSLDVSHHVMQPGIDVLVQFIPNKERHPMDITHGIIKSIQHLKFENFKNYIRFVTTKLDDVAQSTYSNVHYVVNSGLVGNPDAISQQPIVDPTSPVDMVMLRTLTHTENIALPFFKIILPIIES